jgi:glycosyltransferase involved in cell wall biosynthesis
MADTANELESAPAAGLRVLIVVDDDCIERYASVAKYMVVGLADAAVRTTVLFRTRRLPEALELGPCEAVHLRPARWPFRERFPASLAQQIDDGKFDVAHCLSGTLLEWVLNQPAFGQLPIVTSITDHADLERWQVLGGRRPRLWAIAADPLLFKAAFESHRVQTGFVKFVRLGVTGSEGAPIMPEADHICSALVLSPLTADAGLDLVLRAMQTVTQQKRELALFLIGAGPAEKSLRKLASDLRLEGQVVFVGAFGQWAEALRGSDLFIVPRKPRRWSSRILRAMVAGRVVLAPRDVASEDLIHDETACLFVPGDEADLARQWKRLVSEPETTRRIGAAARERVRAKHSISAMGEALIDVYGQTRSAGA